MRGNFAIATEQALAIATVTETFFALAAAVSAAVSMFTVTLKVGNVSEAVIACETAFSIEVIERPWPGTSTCGSAWPTSAMLGRARATSAATITPDGPVPASPVRFTPSCAATLRAYGLAWRPCGRATGGTLQIGRSEEHTSEL